MTDARRSSAPLLALAAALLAAGCLPPPVSPESLGPVSSWVVTHEGPDISLQLPSGPDVIHIEKNTMSGPRSRFEWYTNEGHPAVRGSFKDHPVDMNYTDNQLSGATNSGIINLRFTREEDGIRLGGMFGGERVALLLSRKVIEGWVSGCSTKLEPQGTDYLGSRTCGGRVEPIRLSITDKLGEHPALNLAIALVSLLGPS